MDNLMSSLPPIIEEDGGTIEVQFVKPMKLFKLPQWSSYYSTCEFVQGTPIYTAGNEGPVLMLIHGAGLSAMGFALLTQELIKFATVLTYDLSGHGYSQTCDLSIDHLIREANLVSRYAQQKYPEKTIILYGHSLGGAIACKMNHEGIIGLVTGDVMEKKTINHIPQMLIMLRSRPQQFESYQQAINYHISSSILTNQHSAIVSVPSYLNEQLQWKVDLLMYQDKWLSWFTGMSEGFDRFPSNKLMILTDYDRLNYSQFKCLVYSIENTGHLIHEDRPDKVAYYLYTFIYTLRIPTTQQEIHLKQQIGSMNFRPKLKEYKLSY